MNHHNNPEFASQNMNRALNCEKTTEATTIRQWKPLAMCV